MRLLILGLAALMAFELRRASVELGEARDALRDLSRESAELSADAAALKSSVEEIVRAVL